MPIFIQALPLSFATFWRYLLLLPFLALFAFIISLASIIPIIGWIVPGTVSAGLTIIGLRCALAARGHANLIDTSKLLNVSVAFCLIIIAAGLFLDGIHWFMWMGLNQAGIEIDPLGLFVGLLGLSYYWSAVLLALLSPTALVAAALAVPMTSAAFSATPKGRDMQLAYGFGSGVVGLMIVMAVWLFAGHIFSFFGEIWTTFGLIASALWAWYQNEPLPWSLSIDPWTAFASTISMTWASSWFFATAVLSWERKVQRSSALQDAHRAANHVSTEDIRALRERRMGSNQRL